MVRVAVYFSKAPASSRAFLPTRAIAPARPPAITDKAAKLGLMALKSNIILKRKDSLNWLVEYLIKQNDYENVIVVYDKMIKIEPDNLALLPNLATAYALSGQKEKAIETDNLLLEKDPNSKPMVDAFIQSLK